MVRGIGPPVPPGTRPRGHPRRAGFPPPPPRSSPRIGTVSQVRSGSPGGTARVLVSSQPWETRAPGRGPRARRTQRRKASRVGTGRNTGPTWSNTFFFHGVTAVTAAPSVARGHPNHRLVASPLSPENVHRDEPPAAVLGSILHSGISRLCDVLVPGPGRHDGGAAAESPASFETVRLPSINHPSPR